MAESTNAVHFVWDSLFDTAEASMHNPSCLYKTFMCRHRHLMLDLGQLLPTAKRDAKLDTKSDRAVINEAAELKVLGGWQKW